MGKFLVVLATKTSIRFAQDRATYEFNIGDLIISFRRIEDSRDKMVSEISHGWMIEVKPYAQNIDEATARAVEVSEFFLSAFCLETGCPVYRANIALAYEITERVTRRIFRQYFRSLPLSSVPFQVPFSPFSEHAETIWGLDREYKNRIHRAIRWFRKGIIGDDPLDQFLCFWHGLESLNSPLAKKFGCEKATKKSIQRKCPHCRKKYSDTITVRGGIEALFNDVGISKEARKRINDAQNGIEHGFADLPKLHAVTLGLLPTMAKILHCGITKVLDISFSQSLAEALRMVAPVKLGDLAYIEGSLEEKDLSKIGIDGYYPFFVLTGTKVAVIAAKALDVTPTFKPHVGCNYRLYAGALAAKNVKINIKFARHTKERRKKT